MYSERARDRDADTVFLCYAVNMEQLMIYKRTQISYQMKLMNEHIKWLEDFFIIYQLEIFCFAWDYKREIL
jgi:hypothetical protein